MSSNILKNGIRFFAQKLLHKLQQQVANNFFREKFVNNYVIHQIINNKDGGSWSLPWKNRLVPSGAEI